MSFASTFGRCVDTAGGPDACHRWTAGVLRKGYGAITVRGRSLSAHRCAWELWIGPIPPGLWVLHKCDNRACVNPLHLFLGTSDDNIADMVSKGRSTRGVRHPRAVLTEDDIRELRRLAPSMSRAKLARRFGISPAHARNIITGARWGHI